MSKKALMVSTIASTIGQFNKGNVELLKQLGYKVDIAANFSDTSAWPLAKTEDFKTEMRDAGIDCIDISFFRSPLKIGKHLKAYRCLRKLIIDGGYELIHTHTPVASAIVRLAARKADVKVIYTAHGFHFYKGAPLVNWVIYYPVEKLLSRYTDVLITINREDYERAKDHFRAKKVEYVSGVGIDIKRFDPTENGSERKAIRKNLGIADDEIMILSVGELNKNKDHETVIKALGLMRSDGNRTDETGRNNAADSTGPAVTDKIRYMIAGEGELRSLLERTAKEAGLFDQVSLLGYRKDVADLYNASDLFVFPSHREGLSVSMMEAIASRTPVICSRIRGNVDLVKDDSFMFTPGNARELAKVLTAKIGTGIEDLYENTETEVEMDYQNLENFSKETVNKRMTEIYSY